MFSERTALLWFPCSILWLCPSWCGTDHTKDLNYNVFHHQPTAKYKYNWLCGRTIWQFCNSPWNPREATTDTFIKLMSFSHFLKQRYRREKSLRWQPKKNMPCQWSQPPKDTEVHLYILPRLEYKALQPTVTVQPGPKKPMRDNRILENNKRRAK